MKVVLDTNVFVSGVFFSGPPYLILQAWRDQKIELIVSPDILAEYQRVGEILAEERPAINLKPILEYVIQNASVYAYSSLRVLPQTAELSTCGRLRKWLPRTPAMAADLTDHPWSVLEILRYPLIG